MTPVIGGVMDGETCETSAMRLGDSTLLSNKEQASDYKLRMDVQGDLALVEAGMRWPIIEAVGA